jgi:hypothetical protein
MTRWCYRPAGIGGYSKRSTGPGMGSSRAYSTGSAPRLATASAIPTPRFGVLDPRPLLDQAAIIAARYGGTGWMISETLAAGLAFGEQLWFGLAANVGRVVERAAGELGIAIQVVDQLDQPLGH